MPGQCRTSIPPLKLMLMLLCMGMVCCTGTPKLADHHGMDHLPLAGSPDQLVVLVFSSTDCPIANAMAPDIERASQETTEAGGRFYLVHARQDLPDERRGAFASHRLPRSERRRPAAAHPRYPADGRFRPAACRPPARAARGVPR